MTEAKKQPHWEVGQRVEWDRVNPYTIVGLVGKAGNIHISEVGRYHVFWHREPVEGRRLLIHHGGPEGFEDLDAVKRQHERVILRYVGIKVDIPPEQQEKGVIPQPNHSFLELTIGLEQLEIPGEQRLVTQWISTLQNISRDLPQARTHGELTGIRGDLEVLLEGKLGRSINRYKKAGADSLAIGLQASRGGLLASVSEAQRQLLMRAQESVAITLGTMRRYNDLERLQLYWNEIVGNAPHITARAARIFQTGDVKDPHDRLAIKDIVNTEASLIRKLAELKGEPYLGRAQEVIKSLNRMQELIDRGDNQRVAALLTGLSGELEIWKRRVRQQYTGVDFGKYALE